MNEQQEPDWKSLYKSLANRRTITWAQKALADALTERSDCKSYEILRHIDLAEKYLAEYRAELTPIPPMTVEESELSGKIHTYFRKYDDSPAGTLVYRLWDASKGGRTWCRFVKITTGYISLAKSQRINETNFNRRCDGILQDIRDDNRDDSDIIMELAIRSWGESEGRYLQMIKTLAEFE